MVGWVVAASADYGTAGGWVWVPQAVISPVQHSKGWPFFMAIAKAHVHLGSGVGVHH